MPGVTGPAVDTAFLSFAEFSDHPYRIPAPCSKIRRIDEEGESEFLP
jgi:hypothetical protein